MKRLSGRAPAAVVLVVLCASSVLGWVTALHVARVGHHDNHDDHARSHDVSRSSTVGLHGLGLALHGHSHDDDTPPHDHESLTRQAATPRVQALARAAGGLAHARVLPPPASAGVRLPVASGHTHGPPARAGTAHVLRI